MADQVVPNDTVLVNGGAAPYNGMSGGDTLYFDSERTLPCKILNLNGSVGNPIFVRPSGGQVVMSEDAPFAFDSALLLETSDYITVDGSGLSGVTYGFDLSAYRGFTAWGCKDTTLRRVLAHNCAIQTIYIATNTASFPGRDRASWTMGNCLIEDCYAHHSGEDSNSCGMYLGRTEYSDPVFDSCIVRNNRVEYTTTEAIQARCGAYQIYGNRVYRSATGLEPGNMQGIYIGRESGNVLCYGNFVLEPGYTGIGVYNDETGALIRIFNNLIVGAGYYAPSGYGIWISPPLVTDDIDVLCSYNTIIDSETDGVFITGNAGETYVVHNIISGSGNLPVNSSDAGAVISNNETGSVASQKFVSPGSPNYNYRLTGTSPARDASTEVLVVDTDYDGRARPKGSGYDLGAFEYILAGTKGAARTVAMPFPWARILI